jgi:osmotically-inducible protein OsmY
MTQATHAPRPDVDIEEDIHNLIAHYPPLQADRHHFDIDVEDGIVIPHGHVQSLISRRYLLERVGAIRGVLSVNDEQLHAEETIRLETGQRIPTGVIANVVYGTVILTGTLPDGMSEAAVAQQVAQVPGVERVVTKFENSD